MTNYKYITNPTAPGTLTLTASGNKVGPMSHWYIHHINTRVSITQVGDVVKFQDTKNTDSQVWDFTEDGHFVNKDSGYVIEASTGEFP